MGSIKGEPGPGVSTQGSGRARAACGATRGCVAQFTWSATGPDMAAVATLLAAVLRLARALGEVLPVFESFLWHYLRRWNGADHVDTVLALVALVRPCPYEELYARCAASPP